MKKIPLILAFSLFAFGCSAGSSSEEEQNTLALKDPVQIQEGLQNSGWDVQDTSAASFHVWEQLSPSSMLLAEDAGGQVLIYGQFADAETAQNAYASTVPLSDDSVVRQDTEYYEQTLTPLSEGQGFWLFRKAGNSVMGAWMQDEAVQAEFDALFNTFLQDGSIPAPVQDPAQQPAGI